MEATATGLRRLRKSGIGSRGNFDPLFQPILDLTIRRNPVGVAVILRPITQGSRAEARQPWAMLHNRFAVELQGQA